MKRCQEPRNRNKYLTLVSTDERKDTLLKYEELWSKIKDCIRSISSSKLDNTDNYDGKYMKINFNSDDNLSLTKTLELYNIIVNRSVFHESSKYYL